MKTNFLYFKERGYEQFTYSTGAQTFTINGAENWDHTVGSDTHVKVTVTDISAGTDHVIPDNGKSYSANVITIAAASSSGFDLDAGDIVTIELIPGAPSTETEACFRADRLLSVHSNAATETEITFRATNGTGADDTVVLTHTSGKFPLIADYMAGVLNGSMQNSGGFTTVCDRQAGVIGKGLAEAGVTRMLLEVVQS